MLLAPTFLALTTSLLVSPGLAGGDPEAGEALYAQCVSCHGADGGGSKAKGAPRLAGQRDDYVVRQLRYFVETTRQSDTMHEQASKITSRTDRKDLAAYINTLDADPPADTISGDAQAGKATFVLCAQCHGGRAHGSSMYDTPRLAGQHDWYLYKQLKAFTTGHRGSDATDIYGYEMQSAIESVKTDKQIKDVIAYINSLE